MAKDRVTLEDVLEAQRRIAPYVVRTPLLRCAPLDEALGCEVWLKPEMLQVTGAFKMRGAVNKIWSLTDEERARGIICSSSGNHGKACALAGKMTGTRIIVVLPDDAPKAKIRGIEELGGEVILGPRLYKDRWAMVAAEVEKHGYTVAHGYEDYHVMAGQGTIGMEILEDLPCVDTVIIPVGGGGLIAGVATAIKTLRPNVRIIGVQAKASDAYVRSFAAGEPVEAPVEPSLADGISCRRPGDNPYPIIMKLVDEMVSVTEENIAEGVRLIARGSKLIAEPTSAVVAAAILDGEVNVRGGERVCLLLTSGNWDMENIGKILDHEHVEGSI